MDDVSKQDTYLGSRWHLLLVSFPHQAQSAGRWIRVQSWCQPTESGALADLCSNEHRYIITNCNSLQINKRQCNNMKHVDDAFQSTELLKNQIKSWAVVVIDNRTAHDIWYSYKPLSGIAVVSTGIIYLLFKVLNWSLFWCPSAFLPFVAKRYVLQQKCLQKWIGSLLLGTWLYNFQPPTQTRSAPIQIIMDRQTARQMTVSWKIGERTEIG